MFPKTGAGAGHSREQKMNPTQALCHVQKKHLNVKSKTMKFLKDNTEKHLNNFKYSDQFLHTIPKAQRVHEIQIVEMLHLTKI